MVWCVWRCFGGLDVALVVVSSCGGLLVVCVVCFVGGGCFGCGSLGRAVVWYWFCGGSSVAGGVG